MAAALLQRQVADGGLEGLDLMAELLVCLLGLAADHTTEDRCGCGALGGDGRRDALGRGGELGLRRGFLDAAGLVVLLDLSQEDLTGFPGGLD